MAEPTSDSAFNMAIKTFEKIDKQREILDWARHEKDTERMYECLSIIYDYVAGLFDEKLREDLDKRFDKLRVAVYGKPALGLGLDEYHSRVFDEARELHRLLNRHLTPLYFKVRPKPGELVYEND